jgi:hypothetical protein
MCQLEKNQKNAIKSIGYWNISDLELPLQSLEVHFFQAPQTNEEQKT